MHPSFEQFVAALRDPSLRSGIGLVIADADADADALLTRHDWTSEYYYKWLALFPAAAAAARGAATAPPTEPVSASVFASAPPAYQPSPWDPAPAVAGSVSWAKRPISGRPRVALIIVGSILGAVLLSLYVLGKYHQDTDASAASRPAVAHSAPLASAVAAPEGKYGLTGPEYELLDAVLASENHSVDELVAKGTSDAQLRGLADQVAAKTSKTCADGKALPDGFDNATFRASFIAGYVVSAKVGPDQAARVFSALADYCLNN